MDIGMDVDANTNTDMHRDMSKDTYIDIDIDMNIDTDIEIDMDMDLDMDVDIRADVDRPTTSLEKKSSKIHAHKIRKCKPHMGKRPCGTQLDRAGLANARHFQKALKC